MSFDFYFDVVCPYAYLGSIGLRRLEARLGVRARRRPILLGGVFRAIGQVDDPNATMPAAKRAHQRHDLARWAAHFEVPLTLPAGHPVRSLTAMRVLSSLDDEVVLDRAIATLYDANFVEGEDIASREALVRVLDRAGLDGASLVAAADRDDVKARLRAVTDEAVARGVFGVPSFFVQDELFWGQDRLDWVEEALVGLSDPRARRSSSASCP